MRYVADFSPHAAEKLAVEVREVVLPFQMRGYGFVRDTQDVEF